jgi:hypothetical protein
MGITVAMRDEEDLVESTKPHPWPRSAEGSENAAGPEATDE